jgi:hypothetical protein
MMSREDYTLVAQVFSEARRDMLPDPEGDIEFGFGVLQERFALAFEQQNPRFNATVFNAECKA